MRHLRDKAIAAIWTLFVVCTFFNSELARADVLAAFEKAKDYASAAASNATDLELARYIEAIRDGLPLVSVVSAASGTEFTACMMKSTPYAFVQWSTSRTTIYVCKRTLDLDDEIIAETFLHEMAHLVAPAADECFATKVELTMMKAAGRMPFKNGYVDSCGLGSFGPFSTDD